MLNRVAQINKKSVLYYLKVISIWCPKPGVIAKKTVTTKGRDVLVSTNKVGFVLASSRYEPKVLILMPRLSENVGF